MVSFLSFLVKKLLTKDLIVQTIKISNAHLNKSNKIKTKIAVASNHSTSSHEEAFAEVKRQIKDFKLSPPPSPLL